ncbi:MAG: MotA/TolQ/ExbB proton channel family protein [Planctomycetaceae bacterium]|jgi:chemotaxis protein MotA|nr:MotA/TolQ/ExbB proton channel family protein [Planctomycetaceae bacterium]
MEIATLIGVISAFVLLSVSIVIAGGNLLGFIDPPALIIIGGGIVCGVMIAFPMDEFMRMPAVMKKIFFAKKQDPLKIILELVSIAETARREGLLALDGKVNEMAGDSFLAGGIRMIVDGVKPETVEAVLESEIEAVTARHNTGAAMISQLGKAAPVFGLIATLIGLILMLAHMDPATIGHHMSVALTGTLYGATSANLFFLPFAGKLRYYNLHEQAMMELKMIGILEIQKGESPRMVKMRLLTCLPERLRPAEQAENG